MNNAIIVGISGASGIVYAVKLLETLRSLNIKTILVVSKMGFFTAREELGLGEQELIAMADEFYPNNALHAGISSGSFLSRGMIVVPCSVKTLSGIAHSYNDNLITRAADVMLKERRKLVLMFRETPLHLGHIDLMQKATMNGAIIMPPVPAFYNKPQTIEDIVNHSVARCLDLFGIENNISARWQ
ncbi:MAG: UbiX family flavin prenyltransferase [Alphaproteobacteria bacterium]|nr:UbiX family flavin prenyltransferase [Alphaproteobacteria bacterium]